MSKDIREIIRVGAILFLITGALAAILAFVNAETAPLIEANQTARRDASMKKVMPAAETFEEKESGGTEGAFLAKDAQGKVVGACVMTAPNGYGGAISMMVGADTELKVTGVDIISMSETAGLGANAKKPEFTDQFAGKSAGLEAKKSGSAGENDIDAMSGATVTSKAVAKGVNDALAAAEKLLKEAE